MGLKFPVMTQPMYLSLLIPYAVILIWITVKTKFNTVSNIVMCLITSLAVWFILYAAFNLANPDPSLAFASVEVIMSENDYEWYIRYIFTNFGALYGLLYYWLCFGIAWLLFSKRS